MSCRGDSKRHNQSDTETVSGLSFRVRFRRPHIDKQRPLFRDESAIFHNSWTANGFENHADTLGTFRACEITYVSLQQIHLIATGPNTLRRAEREIVSCEHCHPDDSEIPFDWRFGI